jgi:xanthine dehydrogenase YagS FAD-binding subunit
MSGPSFHYVRATGLEDAVAAGAKHGAIFLAGGTDLLQLWKAGIVAPREVIDISSLPLTDIFRDGDTLVVGALARMSDVSTHCDVKTHHPLIRDAILASASGQVRNLATVGGNLLQRTRCPYFRDKAFACNKRDPGAGCGARDGENRHAAIFGGSEGCVATHASDLAVALAALDAEIIIRGAAGERLITLQQLYQLPSAANAPNSSLAAGDMLTAIRMRNARKFAQRSTYLKIRDRASFEFAVVSVAAALRIEDGVIAEARLAAGGVAPLPWRLSRSEAALVGRAPTEQTLLGAAELATEGASPLEKNAFKVPLLRNAVIRALQTIGGHT